MSELVKQLRWLVDHADKMSWEPEPTETVSRATARIEALEAALRFYADPQNWEPVYDRQFGRYVSPMDDGKRARAALPHP